MVIMMVKKSTHDPSLIICNLYNIRFPSTFSKHCKDFSTYLIIIQHKAFYQKSPHILTTSSNQIIRMKGRETVTYLILATLLLAVSPCYYFTTPFLAQATKSVDFKVKPAEPRFESESKVFLDTQSSSSQLFRGKENTKMQAYVSKYHKARSGPSPIGNRNPPFKP